jgi:uncharacterized protein YjiS (DUF1127 family)
MTKQAQYAAGAAFGPHAGEAAGLFAKLRRHVSKTLQHLSREAGNQQAIWELSQLDDHALRDIGIHRFEIEALVRRRK